MFYLKQDRIHVDHKHLADLLPLTFMYINIRLFLKIFGVYDFNSLHLRAIIVAVGLHLKNFGFFEFIFISSNCCCTHLLANSKVLELLDIPFQSYDGFCPCIDLKIKRETTRNTNDERQR